MDSPRQSTRRDFLQGRAAADRVLDLTWGPAAPTPLGTTSGQTNPAAETPPPRGGYLVHLGRPAMACQFELYFNADQYAEAAEPALAALDRIDQLEDQLSVYRAESEVARLNRAAFADEVEVEAGLFDLLAQSLEIFAATGGAFDVTSGPLSKAWGFFYRAGRLPSDDELAAARQLIGSQHVTLDAARRTVRFTLPGLEVNFNSIGKGYALDRAMQLLLSAGVGDFLFHGGQSSVIASGNHAGRAEGGWVVGLRHPLRPEQRIAELVLRDEALGTSGSATQFFQHQGRRYGHVLDPRTGWPAEGVLSSTVIAPTAAEADALATAFYVLGPAAALQFCQRRSDLGLLMICPGGRTGEIELHMAGLDASRLTLLAESQ